MALERRVGSSDRRLPLPFVVARHRSSRRFRSESVTVPSVGETDLDRFPRRHAVTAATGPNRGRCGPRPRASPSRRSAGTAPARRLQRAGTRPTRRPERARTTPRPSPARPAAAGTGWAEVRTRTAPGRSGSSSRDERVSRQSRREEGDRQRFAPMAASVPTRTTSPSISRSSRAPSSVSASVARAMGPSTASRPAASANRTGGCQGMTSRSTPAGDAPRGTNPASTASAAPRVTVTHVASVRRRFPAA